MELAPGDEAARLGEAETLVRSAATPRRGSRLDEELRPDARERPAGPRPGPPARRLPGPSRSATAPARSRWPSPSGRRSPAAAHAETVALALAELGRCDEAAGWQRRAVERAGIEAPARVGELGRALAAYDKGVPCRP